LNKTKKSLLVIGICDFDKIFTEGQSMQRHLPQYFFNKHSPLWFIAKNFEADTA